MLNFESVEEVCESKSITLVVHPAIRRAVKGYEESFYVGLQLFPEGRDRTEYSFCLCRMVAMSGWCSRSVTHPEGTRSLESIRSLEMDFNGSRQAAKLSYRAGLASPFGGGFKSVY